MHMSDEQPAVNLASFKVPKLLHANSRIREEAVPILFEKCVFFVPVNSDLILYENFVNEIHEVSQLRLRLGILIANGGLIHQVPFAISILRLLRRKKASVRRLRAELDLKSRQESPVIGQNAVEWMHSPSIAPHAFMKDILFQICFDDTAEGKTSMLEFRVAGGTAEIGIPEDFDETWTSLAKINSNIANLVWQIILQRSWLRGFSLDDVRTLGKLYSCWEGS
ncbi:hypothetical protein BKA67DRAFT_662002 [Truncatella angustata]|uniref:Uncharacterized protein n=1 Tax=Truncatella angustata TaxID=152316 RepID=A0A9P8UFX4_9PEZI|nr:uncharacterized protein BKA67DRAFT_662002 [Truncatella angustata]KAH6649083.1 hypothetical protein BKA67DRAFT_662002 [Truncatella angustata]